MFCYLNRRAEARTYLCGDCGYYALCPRCDIALAVHRIPRPILLCHHCAYETGIFTACPACHGTHMKTLSIGIQGVETAIREVFADMPTVRIDSDRERDERLRAAEIDAARIVLGTELAHLHALGTFELAALLLVETELAIPEYDIEEQIYTHAAYHRARGTEVILQTYLPDAPLIRDLADGNYRDFFMRTLSERKQFGYPPYGELAYVWVRDPSLDRVHDIIHRLVNKLTLATADTPDVEIFFDRTYSIRRADEHIQKIIVKGPHITPILDTIRPEAVRNPQVRVEWR